MPWPAGARARSARRRSEDDLYEDWGLNALPAVFNADEARGLTETYVLKIGEDVFTARIVDGVLEPSCGAAPDADLVVETDAETFFQLCAGELSPKDAVKCGRVRVEGDRAAFERCFRSLHVRAESASCGRLALFASVMPASTRSSRRRRERSGLRTSRPSASAS